ncbi:beta strand repeat-containing protein [Methylobacterium durans]|uniref:beta strand repeat-containing protein n=1 Tax=Methylobacterium durans TaxID=2202825 RepID=UPI001F200722|nr:calcium-binding protein [Methylobacterium durans]
MGDSGQADFEAGIIVEIASISPEVGDKDTIKLGRGRNVVVGGAGGDAITAGDGANVVIGDAGHAKLTPAGLPILVETTYDNVAGDDTITLGNGDSVVLGGSGNDTIQAGTGRSVVLGDNGRADFDAAGRVTQAVTTAPNAGGRDLITLGSGGSVVIGGVGADEIRTGSGADVIVGDNGNAVFLNGILTFIETLDSSLGLADLIDAGEGANVVMGGVGGDDITTGSGADVIVGDDGQASFTLGILTRITTKNEGVAGDDVIRAGDGANVVLGGSGSDRITTGTGADVVFGDNGAVDFVNGIRAEALSERAGGGGRDTIVTGSGADLVVGGLGADTIDAGKDDTDDDIVFGDDAHITFDAQGRVSLAETIDPTLGGDDEIEVGAGNNIVLGGAGSDRIVSGAGADVVFGDNGAVTFAGGIRLEAISDRNGGAGDTIETGAGADLVIGGLGADTIDAGATDTDADIVFGDDGHVTFDAIGRVKRAESIDPTFGGDDIIRVGGGDNVVIAGTGDDTVTALGGSDVVIGDAGYAVFSAGVRVEFASTDTAVGGNDTIDAGDGDNLVIGGSGSDTITTGAGADVVLGDNGLALFERGVRARITSDRNGGARDRIATGAGADVVLGGLGSDTIDAGRTDADADIVFGDDGNVTFDAQGRVKRAESLDPGFGGDDEIEVGGGDNVVIAGTGADIVTALGGSDVVIGDDGYALFEAGLRVEFASTDPNDGGNDRIDAGNGDNIIIGGVGADTLISGSGADIVLGDNGVIRFEAGLVREVYTTDERIGSGDVIKAGDGANIVLGGAGRDAITTGSGADVILGDHGEAGFTGGRLTRIASLYPTRGDDDTILAGDGDNTIIGGTGRDEIRAGSGADVALGDSGLATFQADGKRILVRSTDVETGDADTIDLGDGDNVVIAGAAGDTVTTGAGSDVILGDHGTISYDAAGRIAQVLSTDTSIGGNDTIKAGDGTDVVVAGFGADSVTAGDGAKIVLGDNGQIDFAAGVITLAQTLDARIGDADVIKLGHGRKLVMGGAGSDTVEGLTGDSVVLGDAGFVRFANGNPVRAETSDVEVAGNDTVTLGDGNGLVMGGSGADTITLGNGRSVVLGDNGTVDLDGEVRATEITATAPDVGGRDVIVVGDGGSVVLGGFGSDQITTGSGSDIVLGDNGAVTLSALVPVYVRTTSPAIGGADEIRAGAGDNVVLGGADADTIVTGAGRDAVLGDNGELRFDAQGRYSRITTTESAIGGDDRIEAGDGDNLVFGGAASDTVTTGLGADLILGDSGEATFTEGRLVLLRSLDAGIGGKDTIQGGAGDNVVLGGADADTITVGGGRDLVLGDSGLVRYDAQGRLAQVLSTDTAIGGDDRIEAGDGANLVLGGAGADFVTTGSGDDLVLGDSGEIVFAGGVIASAVTLDAASGGGDVISAGAGDNLVMGGLGGDRITTGGGADAILGDHGRAVFTGGLLVVLETIDPSAGGDDEITAGDGDNLVFGGVGADRIVTGAGADMILGDNGRADLDVADTRSVLRRVRTTDPLLGGNDAIDAGEGNDYAAGGTGADVILGGGGHDVLFGDHMLYDRALPANQRAVSIFTAATDGGGNDRIEGGAGDDFLYGQQGDDVLLGGAGDDDITGGHNVLGGADGSDTIEGGAGADVVLGDNGIITRNVLVDDVKAVAWQMNPGTFADTVRRDVMRFDLIDFVGGNDLIDGGAGDDRLFGQIGDDRILGGDGSDEIVGGLGRDTIDGGAGLDILLGDEGRIVRAYAQDGSAVLNSDGTWHRDVVLEEIGTVTASIATDSRARAETPGLSDILTAADLLLAVAGYDAAGGRVLHGDNGAWSTGVLAVSLAAADDDVIDGGAGNDILFGQRGNDTLRGGTGDDLIFGDRASNLAETVSDQPAIVNAVRLIGAAAGTGLVLPLGGEVVVPAANLLPSMLAAGAPRIEVYPALAGAAADIAGSGPIRRADGTSLTAFASIVPSLLNARGVLAGNDTIDGGDGNDAIYGDSGETYALDVTAYATLNGRIDAVSGAMQDLLNVFQDLSRGVDMQNAALGRPSAAEFRYGNDTITGGAGSDLIVGDAGRTIVRGTGPLRDLSMAAATALNGFLDDMQRVIGDLALTARFAEAQTAATLEVLAGQPAGSVAANLPDRMRVTHRIAIGNDVIDGGADGDVVVGDNLVLLQSGAGRMLASHDPAQSGSAFAVEAEMSRQWMEQNARRADHAYRDHGTDPLTAALGWIVAANAPNWSLELGNDRISGGGGNDTLVGDTALIQVPVAGDPATPASLALDRAQATGRIMAGAAGSLWDGNAYGWGVGAYGGASNAYGWGWNGFGWNAGAQAWNGYGWGAGAFGWNGYGAGLGAWTGAAWTGAAWNWANGSAAAGFGWNLGTSTVGRDVIAGGEGDNRIFASTATLVPALDAAGRVIGPNALTALLPGDIGLAQGVFNPGQYAASVGTLSTAGAPSYSLNFGYGVPFAGRWGGPALAAYGANYLAPNGTVLPWGWAGSFVPGYAYAAPDARAAYAWNAASLGGVYTYPFWPGSPALSPYWNGGWSIWGATAWGASSWPAAFAGRFGWPAAAPGWGLPTLPGLPNSGGDEVTGGNGAIYAGVHKRIVYWTFDAGVTLPALGAATADTLTAQARAGRPSLIQAVTHRPVLADEVIRSITGGDIVLRATPAQAAAAQPRYRTWLFDEAKGSLVTQTPEEDDILFLASRPASPTDRPR